MNTQEKIINSARQLFTKYGYKKVSMDEIAQTSGVTKKTVYAYFKNKNELFEYFVNEEIKKMKDITLEIEKKNISFIDKLHQMIYEIIKYKKQSEFLNIITNEIEVLKNSEISKFNNKVDNSIRDFISSKLKNAISKKQIKNINIEFASFIIYTLYMSIIFAYPSEELNEDEISNTLTTILSDGLISKGENI